MNTNKDWEKEFDSLCSTLPVQLQAIDTHLGYRELKGILPASVEKLKSFITEQIQKAREEERKAFSKKLQEAIKDTQSMEDLTARLFMIIVQATTSPTENEGSSQ